MMQNGYVSPHSNSILQRLYLPNEQVPAERSIIKYSGMSAAMQRTLRKHIVLASLSVLTIQDPMQKKVPVPERVHKLH